MFLYIDFFSSKNKIAINLKQKELKANMKNTLKV